MKPPAFFALLGLVVSPLVVVHALSPPADSVHFSPVDYEQWERDHPRPAAKRLTDLNVGPPRTVRLIYFLPNDRPYRAESESTPSWSSALDRRCAIQPERRGGRAGAGGCELASSLGTGRRGPNLSPSLRAGGAFSGIAFNERG